MAFFIHYDGSHFRRLHGIDHQLRRVVVPQDDINTFTGQLVGNGLDASTAHTDTSANRINTLVVAFHGDLGARAGITGCALDLDQLFTDFRHFNLEQLNQHVRAGTACKQLWATIFFVHAQQVSANPVILTHRFAGNHVLTGDQRFRVAAQIQNDGIPAGFLDDAADQLTNAITILFDDLATLGFAHFLHDDLLGCLGTDTTKGFGFDFLFPGVADLQRRILFMGFIEGQLLTEFVKLFIGHHVPYAEGARIAGYPVDIHANFHVFFLKAFFGSGRQSKLDGLENHVTADAFFV